MVAHTNGKARSACRIAGRGWTEGEYIKQLVGPSVAMPAACVILPRPPRMLVPLRTPSTAARLFRNVIREFSACACALPDNLPLSEAAPASVSEYHQHILIKLPRPEGQGQAERSPGSWWGQFLEKDPRIFEAFKSIAKHPDQVSRKIKLTAFDDVGSSQPLGSESCEVMAFPDGLRYSRLPLEHLGQVVLRLAADEPSEVPAVPRQVVQLQEPIQEVVLLVCCHGARDARCGALGPPLASKLLHLVRSAGLQQRIRVYKTSHVGGHKYAGNVLVYGSAHPCDGDWFGGVNADNAEQFLEAIAGVEVGVDGGAEDAALRQWWRGRMGLSKTEQGELFEQGGGVEAVELLSGDEEEEDGEEEGWEEEWEARMNTGGGKSWPGTSRG